MLTTLKNKALDAKDWVLDMQDAWTDYFCSEDEDAPSSGQVLDLDNHRYPSFTALLPYQYYDETSKLFFNETNTGLLYRITPLTGANEKIAEQLDQLLRTKVSDEFTLQVILVKHNQVGHGIDAFAAQFAHPEFENLERLGENLKTYYQQAARTGFKTKSMVHPRITHTECFIVVDRIKSGSESDDCARFAPFKVSFEASLSAIKIGFKRGGTDDFLHLLNFFLKNDPDNIYPQGVHYDKTRTLNHQVVGHAFDSSVDKGEVLIRGVSAGAKAFETAVSVLTIDTLPREFHLWETLNNTSNIFNPEQSIPCNHIISVVYVIDEQNRAQSRANRKTRDLDKKSKSDYALHVAGTEEKARAWRDFRDNLTTQKTRACKMLYNVVLFSRPDEKERDVEAAISAYAYNQVKLARVQRMQLPYFLVSMPFLFTGNLSKDFALPTMMWPISSWNATQYMPLLSDWSGVSRGILLPTMREQFACIDPFSGAMGSNYNLAVTGASGGGKSFFIQMLMLNVLFNGGDIFIIDVGGSYRKLCESLGGTYLEYSNLAMNPFTHVANIQRELSGIIALFELLTCPKEGASDDDTGTLRSAILNAFEKTANDTCIDDVQQALLDLYEEDQKTYSSARILSKNLEPYASCAEHGRVFNEPSRLSPRARIIVVDLQEIEEDVNIRAPVLLSVIAQFQHRMFNSDRSKQKMCVIDEAWSFFTGDKIASNFITKGFRTGRRHKASFVTITQGIEDYYEFSEARAAWENSSVKLIFLQEPEALDAHQKAHETFSDYEMNLLKAFPVAREAGFSQVMLRVKGMSSFHRLFVDPFTRVLLSSDGDDYQAVLDYVAAGLAFSEAVERVALEHEEASHAHG